MRRGQTTLEYILLIGVVAAGLIAMLVYVSRGHQGNLRSQANQLSEGQYAPGNTNINNNSENKTLTSTANAGSKTTVDYGNINEPNTALEVVLAAIVEKWREIYALRQEWELLAVPEAIEGAAAVRGGNFNWQPPVPGLREKGIEIDEATNVDLQLLYDQAKVLADAWAKRIITKDTTTSGSYSSETGTIITHKEISETLGDL